jgi:glutamate/tyrosine decarboxylase-like PLP-dependent enzyme
MTEKLFPDKGRSWEHIEKHILDTKKENYDWRSGRVPNGSFYVSEDLLDIVKKAYLMYFSENALLKGAFPGLDRLEKEIVQMTSEILQGGEEAVGTMTSGGTESIFLAMKSARDYARANNSDLKKPNIVIPYTAHPAYSKSAHYLDVDVIQVPVRDDFRADVEAMAAAVNQNTIMMVGSAPEFSLGMMDPIEELGELALQKNLWLHVDACIGGFLAPFVRKLGYRVPAFEFSVPGVTSISADLHKMGYTAKPASTILYRSAEYQEFQYFSFSKWPRGAYKVATFTGSRPSGAVAAAWATLTYLGQDGYLKAAERTMDVRQALFDGITAIPAFKIIGDPELCIFTFSSDVIDINSVANQLRQRGWYVGFNPEPPAIHWFLTPMYEVMVKDYIKDLKDSVEEVKAGKADAKKFDVRYG